MARRVTLVDVARVAGVDKAVVSRVVNDDPTLVIRPDTRARVRAALDDLGYRPNQAARSLRTAHTKSLGLVIPDFSNPVYAEIIAGAEAEALARDYVLLAGSSSSVGGSPSRYLDLLGDGRVDGLLLAGGTLSSSDIRTLGSLGLPWLMLNNRTRSGGHRYVVLDDVRAASLAVDHLVELGHRRIGLVAGPSGADTATRRRRGYQRSLRAADIELDDTLVAEGDYTPDGGRQAIDRLLAAGASPTGVFVANVASAVGVIDGLRAAGLSVPGDVSVVGMHDLPLAAHLAPPLTTVRMPLRRLGARGVELLLTADAQAEVEEQVGDDIELVVRESTAPPRDPASG